MSRMKVVLRQDVENLGDIGAVVTVAGGYARNFLIPRGLAAPATKGNVKQSEDWRQGKRARASKQLREAGELRTRLEAQPLSVGAQAGPDGRLFGSITSTQISEAIASTLGAEVDRHVIELPEPIRHLGFHQVKVRLSPEITANVTIEAVEA